MADFSNRSQNSTPRRDYIWQYEYYDDDEPVSFEGLRAHKYSIVIGFWVGLAVFVIFMFFVLTLLTKPRAPHQESRETSEKPRRADGCLVNGNLPQDKNVPSSTCPLLSESQPYSHFYIQEDLGKKTPEVNRFGEQNKVPQGSGQSSSGTRDMDGDLEEDFRKEPLHVEEEGYVYFTQFNIPDLASLDSSTVMGEDELLYEPSVVLELQAHRREAHHDIH